MYCSDIVSAASRSSSLMQVLVIVAVSTLQSQAWADSTSASATNPIDITRYGALTQRGDGVAGLAGPQQFTFSAYTEGPSSAGQVSVPGESSPLDFNLPYGYTSSGFNSQAALDRAFPTGRYHFSINSFGSVSNVSFSDYRYLFPSTPYFTGDTYSSMQGADASVAVTFSIAPDSPRVANTTHSVQTLLIDDTTTHRPVIIETMPFPGTTSFMLPAGTLTPGHTFYAMVQNWNSVDLNENGQYVGSLTSAIQTTMNFYTAAVPEARTYLMFLSGLALLSLTRRRHVASERRRH